jgi:CspA family cold shock protein
MKVRRVEGTVKRWVNGYGFIEPDEGGEDVFIHHTDLNGTSALRQGQKVEFAVEKTPKGL